MASATSKASVVTTGTSVRNRKKSYYVTDVTTLADGSCKRNFIDQMQKEIIK